MTNDEIQKERDAVKRQRQAFIQGASFIIREERQAIPDIDYITEKARAVYPLPRLTRPRVITANGQRYRVKDGWLEVQGGGCNFETPWEHVPWLPYLTDGLARIAELIANPTEVIEDEE